MSNLPGNTTRTRRLWRSTSLAVVAGSVALFACSDQNDAPTSPSGIQPQFYEAGATQIDLTAQGSNAVVNGAQLISFNPATSTGTGVYLSFVRVSSNQFLEQGYNTSGRPLQFDENSSPTFTHDLPLNKVPLQPCGFQAGFCREFNADINQESSVPLLDLLSVRLFVSQTAGIHSADPTANDFGQGAGTSLVWDMDGDGPVYARFNYNNSTGSGGGDIKLLIPVGNFPAAAEAACPYDAGTGPDCGYYLYLYSKWGTSVQGAAAGNGENNDGFEEWNTRKAGFVTVTKTATTTFTRKHKWSILKSVDPTACNLLTGESCDANYKVEVKHEGYDDSNWMVTGNIHIENPTGDLVKLASVTDVISKTGDPDINVVPVCGVTFPYDLASKASLDCTYAAALPDATSRTNTATATIVDAGANSGTAAVTFSSTPTEEIDEKADITDTYKGDLGDVTAPNGDIFTYKRTFTCDGDAGTWHNTATLTTNDTGTELESSADVVITCGKLEVTKDASTSLTRTYNWTIEKSVSPDHWDLFVGDDGTSHYTVKVTKTGYTDSEWKVTGNIKVHNPSAFAISVTGVSDNIDGGVGAATVSCPVTFPYSLAAGADLNCTYSSALPDGTDRTNTATASVSGGSFDGTADVKFASATINEVNATIHVTDDKEGPLGSASDTKEFTYDHKFVCGSDQTYKNTASIDETGDDASATVVVKCYSLAVTKDATTSFTRTWTWTLKKGIDTSCFVTGTYDVASNTATIQEAEALEVCYQATLDATSADSKFHVTGGIKVHNNHPSMAADLTAVVDELTPGPIAATVSCPSLTVAAGGDLNCTYNADLSDKTPLTNKATATQQNYSYDGLGGSSNSGTTDYAGTHGVSFSSTPTEEFDECVDVDDLLQNQGLDVGSKDFGTYCANQPLPKTFNYSYFFGPNDIPVTCDNNQFDNTVTAETNDNGIIIKAYASINIFVQCEIGCTLTQGYWKTHNNSFTGGASKKADPTWQLLPGGMAENTIFFLSNQTWFEVFWTKPQGNVYYNLADQYMAAVLNGLAGASTAAVDAELAAAKLLFETYTPAQIGDLKGKPSDKALRDQFISLADKLTQYNEGLIGPGHCTENSSPG